MIRGFLIFMLCIIGGVVCAGGVAACFFAAFATLDRYFL